MPYRLITSKVAYAVTETNIALLNAKDPQSTLTAAEVAAVRSELAGARAEVAARRDDLIAGYASIGALREQLDIARRSGDAAEIATAEAQFATALIDRATLADQLAGADDSLAEQHGDAATDMGTAAAYTHLDRDVPVALLPVRLETRYFDHDEDHFSLWVRIYPDDIHVDDRQPLPTVEEDRAGREYWQHRLADGPEAATTLAAWHRLCRRFGEGRATELAAALDPFGRSGRFEPADLGADPPLPTPPVAPPGWSDPARARALPDRWAITGYRGDARVLLAFTGPVRPDPRLTPEVGAPGEELTGGGPSAVDAGIEWLTDFDAAEQIGMAARITVDKTIARSMDRLVVFGVRASDDPTTSRGVLTSLMESHAADSLHFVPPGSPTNNTDTTRSAYRARPSDHAESHARFVSNRADSHAAAYQDRVADALGIDAAAFRHAEHAADRRELDVEAMHVGLWPTTFAALLRDHVEVATTWDDQDVVRTLFTRHVRPAGALPAIRLGAQPYGILPAVSLGQWRPRPGPARQQEIVNLLRSALDVWMAQVHRVPRVFDVEDPQRGLVEAISRAPSGAVVHGRHVFWSPPQRALEMRQQMAQYWAAVAPLLSQGPVDLYATHGGVDLDERSYSTNGAYMNLVDLGPPMPVVSSQPERATALTENYIERLAQFPGLPEVTTFGVVGAGERPLLYRLLAGAYVQQAFHEQTSPYYPHFFAALERLGDLDVETLETLCLSAIDSATYRLDAWVSAVAGMRLAEARSATASGIQLGGFGWVEGLQPPGTPPPADPPIVDDPDSAGYLHLPSPGQATTAAVLHGAHLAHGDQDSAETLSMQLDSDRVRLARWLLEGMREGQSLGALLGYRLERLLLAAQPGLGHHIAELRAAAPLRVSQDGVEGTPVAAVNVVDGVQLLRMNDDDELEAAVGAAIAADVQPALAVLGHALDAVSDLLLAEGVHHATGGRPSRAGAAFDAMADGGGAVPEVEVTATPSLGRPVGHRLMVALPASATSGWAGDDGRLRAIAEPRLNAWAASLFGDPARIRFRAVYTAASGAAIERSHALDEFDVCPLDVVHLSAPRFDRAPLTAALTVLLQMLGPDGNGSFDGTVEVRGGDPGAAPTDRPLDEVVALADEVASVLREGRPLEAADVHLADPESGVVVADMTGRQAGAAAAFTAVRNDFAAQPDDPARWWRAALLVGAAEPGTAGGVAAVHTALDQRWSRHEAVQALDPVDGATVRLRALLGEDFLVVPTFDPPDPGQMDASFADQAGLVGGGSTAAKRWLEDYGRVRPACDALDMVLTLGDAAGAPAPLDVAQLPHVEGTPWIGEVVAPATPARVSIVAHRPFPMTFDQGAIAGVLVDAWADTIPEADSVTGLAFHYDAPKARAPQSILLVPPPDLDRDWEFEDIEQTVLQTLDLAKTRGIEISDLPRLGYYLPAVFFIHDMDQEWTP